MRGGAEVPPAGLLARLLGPECCGCGGGGGSWRRRPGLSPPAPLLAGEKAFEAWHVPGSEQTPLEPTLWLKWREEGQLVSLCVSYILKGCWCHMLVACQGARSWSMGGSVARIGVDADFVTLAAEVHARFVPTVRRILNEGAGYKHFVSDAKLWRLQASCLMRSDVEERLGDLRKSSDWGGVLTSQEAVWVATGGS